MKVLLQSTIIAGLALSAMAQIPQPLLLSNASKLLTADYPKNERGYAKNSDGMYFVSGEPTTQSLIEILRSVL
jgi:hypothetical protein